MIDGYTTQSIVTNSPAPWPAATPASASSTRSYETTSLAGDAAGQRAVLLVASDLGTQPRPMVLTTDIKPTKSKGSLNPWCFTLSPKYKHCSSIGPCQTILWLLRRTSSTVSLLSITRRILPLASQLYVHYLFHINRLNVTLYHVTVINPAFVSYILCCC